MAEFVPITGSSSLHRKLKKNDSFQINFRPKAGGATANIHIFGPLVLEEKEIGPFLNGRIEVTFLSPTGIVARKVVSVVNRPDLHGEAEFPIEVPAELAGQNWRCRFKNVGTNEVGCAGQVVFVKRWHKLITTALSMRVLNHALHQVIDALGLIIHLDGKDSFIDFSDELKELSGGRIKPIEFDLPGPVRDISLKTLHIQAGRRFGNPAIRIFLQFETSGVEFSLGTFLGFDVLDIDITNAAITITLVLETRFGKPGNRAILPSIDVDLNFDGALDGAIGDALEEIRGNLRELADDLEPAIRQKLNNSEIPIIIGEYLTKAFVRLAARQHTFHEIRADDRSFLVKHFDARVEVNPNQPDDDTPLIISPPLTRPGEKLEEPVNLDQIEHIVVLMQENRSFDHMLGYLRLDGGRDDIDGLTGQETNTVSGLPPVKVNRLLPTDTAIPFSPAHDFTEVVRQISDGAMSGFADSFLRRFPGADERLVMGFFDKTLVRTFDTLAKNYMVCNNWFCSFPGHTQPNRFCTLSGQIPSLFNFDFDEPQLGYLNIPTLFDLLTAFRVPWIYYEQDVAFLRFYDKYRLHDERIIPFDDPREGFLIKARQGTLPKVTFIDPNFVDFPPTSTANDDHPPADIALGQDMIARIHDALVGSPLWGKMLFVITYDEHGGFFDHVPPPGTPASSVNVNIPKVHPDAPAIYGPRVPAFIISPFVPEKSVSNLVIDHMAIYKTIVLKFLGPAFLKLTPPRVRAATQLGLLLTEGPPRLNLPTFGALKKPRPKPRRIRPDLLPKPERDDFHEAVRRFGLPPLKDI